MTPPTIKELCEKATPGVDYQEHPEFPFYKFYPDGRIVDFANEIVAGARAKRTKHLSTWFRTTYGKKKYGLHRVIARVFHGEPPTPKHQALHKNDVADDNRPESLYWGTPAQNMADAKKNGGTQFGERNHASKLTQADVNNIRASSLSQSKLAAQYGVAQSTISDIRTLKKWPLLNGKAP